MNNLPNPFETNNINSNVLSKLNELKKINTNQNISNLSFFKDKKDSIQIQTNYNSSFLNNLNKLINNHNLVKDYSPFTGPCQGNDKDEKLVITGKNNNTLKVSKGRNIKQQQLVMDSTNNSTPLKKVGILHTYLKNNLFPSQGLAGSGTGQNKNINGTIFHYNKYIDYNFNNNKPLPLSFNFTSYATTAVDNSLANVTGSSLQSKGENLISNVTSCLVKEDKTNMPLPGHWDTNKFINYTDNLLIYFFKSMYCLISKPVYLITPEKVTIQLFYFLNIPKKNIFKLYYLFYNKKFKKNWIKLRNKALLKVKMHKNNRFIPLILVKKRKKLLKISRFLKLYKSTRLRIRLRWKKRRPILRLRSKFNTVLNLLLKLRKYSIDTVYKFKFNLICSILSKKFNRPVELQLIRLHHPYHDSNILVNLLALNLKNKKKKSRVAISKIHSNKVIKKLNDPNLNSMNLIPSFLSGLNINIAGRLMREPIIPRKTTKFYEKGATATGKVNYLDVATITKKNKKGAFTIKISSGQNLF